MSGAAGAAAVVATTAGNAAAATVSGTSAAAAPAAQGPVLAYVHDASKGEVVVMRGETEVVVHDPALVRSLTKHAAKGA